MLTILDSLLQGMLASSDPMAFALVTLGLLASCCFVLWLVVWAFKTSIADGGYTR